MTVQFAWWKRAASEARQMTTETESKNEFENEPWYRNPWVWLIIAIPALTVIGGLFTIYLAISRPDYLVDDTSIKEETPASQSR